MTATIKDLIENLERLPNTDAVRRKNNSYALNEKEEITALSLSNSKVTAITLTEDALALEHLYLNANESLETIYFTAALPHLKHLYIEECALKELAIPAGCKGLEQLYARKNKLQQVDFKGDCPALELLDLSDNELKKISINHDFERLKYLYLGSSHIEELHLFTTLPSLNTLHLENNRLKKVPQLIIDKILNDDAIFETLDLRSNTPENIPKVFVGKYSFYKSSLNCIEKARLWFEELRDNKPTGKNKTIKLMLLGNGNAGKTSLVCALDKGKCTHEHPTTHGIQIQPLTFDDVTYHIWDFGGQEVYHGTHKLFMESVALQLILFDPETEERANKSIKKPDRANEKPVRDYPIKYWYDTTFSKSEESLFILVQNKVDEFPVVDKENRNFSDGKAEFIHISAKEGTRVNILKGLLKEEARKLPEYGMEMPQSFS